MVVAWQTGATIHKSRHLFVSQRKRGGIPIATSKQKAPLAWTRASNNHHNWWGGACMPWTFSRNKLGILDTPNSSYSYGTNTLEPLKKQPDAHARDPCSCWKVLAFRDMIGHSETKFLKSYLAAEWVYTNTSAQNLSKNTFNLQPASTSPDPITSKKKN